MCYDAELLATPTYRFVVPEVVEVVLAVVGDGDLPLHRVVDLHTGTRAQGRGGKWW